MSLSLASAAVVKSLTATAFMLSWAHSVEWQDDGRIAQPGFQIAQAQEKKAPDVGNEPPPKTLSAKELAARGNDFNTKGDLARAIADYDAALKIEPAFAEVLNSRAMVWRAKGDHGRALADLDAALRLKPDFEAARANRKVLFHEIELQGAKMPLKPAEQK